MENKTNIEKIDKNVHFQTNQRHSIRSKSQKQSSASHIALINSCDEDPKQNTQNRLRSTCFTIQTVVKELKTSLSDKEDKTSKASQSFISNNDKKFHSQRESIIPKIKSEAKNLNKKNLDYIIIS